MKFTIVTPDFADFIHNQLANLQNISVEGVPVLQNFMFQTQEDLDSAQIYHEWRNTIDLQLKQQQERKDECVTFWESESCVDHEEQYLRININNLWPKAQLAAHYYIYSERSEEDGHSDVICCHRPFGLNVNPTSRSAA